jgi:uncharacterized protein (DUF169 family)
MQINRKYDDILHIIPGRGGLFMKNEFTRREALELGLGAVALGVSGAAVSAAQTPQRKGNSAPSLNEFNKAGEALETSLILRTSPIAVKMLEKEEDVPARAFRPKRDGKYHIAQCQAFGMSRREGKTVAMLKEDHWCPTALSAYGMVPPMAMFGESFKSFETGKYVGIVSAPLKSSTFMPDVVLIYLNPAQLRELFMPFMMGNSPQINTFYYLPSCAHCIVDPMVTGQYCVVLPDPGEYQRALAREEELIFAVPQKNMPQLMSGFRSSFRDRHMDMHPDFEQPSFYKQSFRQWGLDTE